MARLKFFYEEYSEGSVNYRVSLGLVDVFGEVASA